MSTNYRTLALGAALAFTLAVVGPSLAAQTTSAQEIQDARHETQIWTAFSLNPYLRANDLKVSVHSGKAVLTGRVEEGISKELAKQIALGVSGIVEVDNQILVQADREAPASSADRSFGERVEDATITATIKSKLLWSKYADGLTTNVDTNRGRVTLHGTADSPAARDLAEHLALNTLGVLSVDNRLEVKPGAISGLENAARAAELGITDSWITAKVKSTLMLSSNVSGTAIKVSTTGGVVTLSGNVDSGAERSLAIELARNVRGVRSVTSTGLKP
ncbi:MAG: BON domain-containing protein [Vicinamibacteria bacterium]